MSMSWIRGPSSKIEEGHYLECPYRPIKRCRLFATVSAGDHMARRATLQQRPTADIGVTV